jgi:hypothetical protein
MKTALAAVLATAFALSMTVTNANATTYATKPVTTKHHTTAHSKCMSMHMGKSHTKSAKSAASKWCTAHLNSM